ncbi:hypothetical protein HK105_209101 [Polyrhizophydium stewartii]|uniref:Carrier domain-containing protein n=1 Tax=Polyrhizophydium stewartii TaxID=2732419 RepID=A0ABR4MW17_9FUNG
MPPPRSDIVPVRIVLDGSASTDVAVAAATESIRAATEHSPVDLAQLRAWCGLSASDPVCDVVLCIGEVSNALLAADLASTGAAIALVVDNSAGGGSVTSVHDSDRLDGDQAASVVDEFELTVNNLVPTLTDKSKVGSLLKPSIECRVGNKNDDINAKIQAIVHVFATDLSLEIRFDESQSFARAGGDSLAAIRLAAEVQKKGVALTAADLMSGKSVKEIIEAASKRGAGAFTWPKVELSTETLVELASVGDFVDAYPATPLQAGMVAATMQDARAYVNQVPLRATRTVSLESLRGALRAAVQHHAILRTSFVSTVAGGIVQVVRASADAAECEAVTAPLAQHLEADKARGFSLADASWIRAALVCDPAGSTQHVVVTIHHALYDGWSLPMIMRDLAAALDGHTLEPRPAFRTVVDFIAAQDAAATEAFWTQQLVGLEPAQPLSLGHSARTDDEDAPLAQACSTPMAELQRAAQRAGVTVAVVLKAAWAATLRKFTRSHDVVFGEVLANRDIAVAGADRIVGPLLNTVPCRVVLDDTARAADLVASLQAQHGAVLSHSHAALVDVQRWAGVQGDGKLFNTLFVYENMDLSVEQTAFELFGSITNSLSRSTDFDLIIFPDRFYIRFEALWTSNLSQSQAASILAEFDFGVQQLVTALADKATVESLWTLSPAQQAAIARFSHGERVPLPFSLVHHGFEARAKQHPDWRAVEHGDAHLSYGDLDACGCALAAALASHGVQRGSRVAVVMQRSIEFVVALVGVLKAGATIVPVDSSFPAGRIQFMLDDASVCAIVTTASEAGRIAQLSVGDRAVLVADARALLASGAPFDKTSNHIARADDHFMILYTSGSTGRPKGVPAMHSGAVNIIANYSKAIGHLEQHRVIQFMAIGFDVCALEIWGSLSHGATLVLREQDAIATASKVDTLFVTPTGLAHLGSPASFPNLKYVSVAGEACPQELADLWSPHCVFHNIYGPTEVTLFSTIARIEAEVRVTVGVTPVNTDVHVLDAQIRKVPVGVVGEMCIGGIGVSRGYINLPDLTAQRFVPDPFSPEPGARMFRTGDLGRLLPDGNFEILGRMDDQVKLKGYRIELDEVAAAMMHHPRVSAAAAVVKDKTHLVGFVVPADVDHDELRDVVAAALPAYMVPAVFVGLAVMPTNTNGKTDKKALAAMHVEIAVDALQTDTERALAAVWSQVLGVQVADIGRATSFFALGGDSISAIKAAAAMQRAGISITVPQLFKAQTVARVAALADAADAHDRHRPAKKWPAAVLSDETLAELASVGDFVDAYPATPLQAGMVAATMQDARAYVNQHHAILRTSFVSTVAGGIVQVVRASADAAECVAVAAPLAQHLAADKARGFSLADARWIRAALVCDPAGSTQHVVVTIHHALYDGWSLPMIMRDLATALDGHTLEPRPAFRTVVDFIAAQDAAATEAFWTQQLAGLEPAQPLSLGHSARTDDEDAPLAQACSTPMTELQRVAQRAGVTVAVVLKAAWAATLRKFTRSHDVVFGELLANRDIAVGGADRIVGPLLNTVPCRVVLDDTVRAADLVASLQAQHGAVLSHSHAALVDVQRWAGVRGDGKLFDSLFNMKNIPLGVDSNHISILQYFSSGKIKSSKSLASTTEILIEERTGRHIFELRYDHSHLSRSQAASILAEFDFGVQQLVSALADKATVESLWTLSPAQQAAIARFSHGERVPLPFSLVHHGFEARAKQHPDWRAVEHGDAHLSYGDLDACGCALAAALASHGVQRGSRVAVVMQRSIEFVVALVGVLKAGATIVPVDSSFPADRIQFMLDDASVCAIVTTASEAGRIAQLSVGDRAVVVADARALLASGESFTPAAEHTATGDDVFLAVYTSGSTGKPKGVPTPHIGAVNVLETFKPLFSSPAHKRVQQFMAIGFDVAHREIWGALNNGCTLILREHDAFKTIANVAMTHMTPTGLSDIGDPIKYPNLKCVVLCGEPCPEALKELWSPHVALYNAYGPTEVSFVSHLGRLELGQPITIGRPVGNDIVHILDSQLRQVPVGIIGEMVTCSPGVRVSRGYINLPDLTAQRFVPDPFSPEPGARMFRTGDLGRLLPDGNFEILGRMDDQVKLKGYRIELDEVAAAMMRHPRVSAAAAVVKDKTHLVGFVVPADVDHDELRDVVAAALPAYMVPAVFVGLAVMPTNTNGKTDKKALAAMHVEIAVDALQTDTERALAAVWSQVLGVHVADIGRATSFFALGGDSISAIKAAAAMQRAGISITVPQLFKAQTVARVAALADAADAHDGHRTATEWPAAVLSDETLAELASVGDFVDAYPATPLQAGMVAATMQDARAYVNQVPLRATRTVSLESLRGALRAVVQHHAILRTSFVSTVAGGIVQVVRASADAAECVAVTAPLAQHLAADKARGFSLADARWIRAALVCDPAGSAQHVVVTIHHALYDGWSLPMIMRDLAAALDGHALEPRPAFRTVVDFIAAQDAAATEAFWTQQLVGLEPAQPLSLGHSARTDDEDAPLAQACSTPMAELQRAAQRAGVTVAVVLKAAWAATLRKFTRSHDVVFGEVLANRDIAVAGADRIVGPLLNTVPCRVVLDDTARAADLVASLQAQHGTVLSHSHAALVDVQRWAGVRGDGRLFDTLFVFENLPKTEQLLASEQSLMTSTTPVSRSSKSFEYSFELVLIPSRTDVTLIALFNHSQLSRSQAASILAEFDFGMQQLVSALADKATVESLWTLSPSQQALIARFSHDERVPLPFSLVHHGFEARAKQHPDWRAVEHGDAHLSYGDLDACGSALAAALASHGVQRGSRVAVVMQRSIEFVVALVGVLKAGATIVPVDSSFPADRIQFMLDDASVCAIVTTASEAGRIAQLSVGDRAVVVAEARALLASGESFTPAAEHTATGDDDAFIVYTSGSTGKPKGVPVPHIGAANVAITRGHQFGCFEGAHMAQFMAISFDGCQWETWSALSHGATLVLREQDAFKTIASVTSLFITPTGLSQLGAPQQLENLAHVTVGGEACPKELKNLWAPHVRFNNAYGPTEISFISHITSLTTADNITLGSPIPNMSCYTLDSSSRSVPIGVVGEMCIGGIGVSRGYINLPDLTAQRFVPDPFSPEPGARMFRSGDLGRLLPDGNFEILGRMDDQVKLKGYRIELDEVAAAMMRHPRVSAAAAVVKDKTHLVGFVVPADVDHDELRDVVAAALPAYMVPAVFVGLAVMPTNTNGKTDKKALAAMHVEIAVDALQTDTERALAAVWSQVLGVQVADIGRATSFFALGGDSISAIKAAAAMQRAGISITVPQLFKAQTVARVAALADAADAHDGHRTATEWPAAVLSDETLAELASVGDFVDAYPATPLQAGMVAATMQDSRAYVNQVPLRATRTVSLESLHGALRAVVQHHAILRTSFVSTVAGGIVQVVRASADAAECVAVAAPLAQHLAADKARGFSLTDASWIRAALVCDPAGSTQHVVVTIHHALYDGWSLPMIMRDLAAALDGHALEPRPAFRTVVDFIAAQDAAATEAFWTQQLVGLEPAQPLSLGHSARTDDEDAPLAQACSTPMAELQRAAQRAGVTVAVVLKAAWAATLRKFTRSHDVVFGQIVSGRDIPVRGVDRVIGPVMNSIPCIVRAQGTGTIAAVLSSLLEQHLAMLPMSQTGFDDQRRFAGLQPSERIFTTAVIIQNFGDQTSTDQQANFDLVPSLSISTHTMAHSIELYLVPSPSQLDIGAMFNHGHLSRSQVRLVLDEFDFTLSLLARMDSTETSMDALLDLSPALQAQIAQFSRGPAVPVEFSCIHHAFEAQVAATPDAIALDDGFATFTYAALDARANQLAHTLQSLGAAPEVSAAVIATRSIEFVVGILGVLKAGAAFVPIEASTPQERIRFMLESCGVPIVATTAEASHAVPASFVGKIVHIDNLPADTPTHKPVDAATARSLAYTIFTSGTTGTPKGVLIEHGGIHTRAKHHPIVTHLGPGMRMLQTFTVGFDACIEEIFHGLCVGATMVLWGRRTIFEAMATVDVMQISPSAMLQIEPAELPRLKAVCAGVEACPQSLVDRWAGRIVLYSDYGPTEATMVATCTARLAPGDRITLGRPLANTAIHILDDASRRVPPGVKGRVFIGGVGIARGYLGQPDLTAERFVTDIDDAGKTMYDTGDIGRWTHDGQIEYLGRSDDQVKLKGYRIELEEVAKVLGECAGVKSAVAMARDGRLVAFVTPAEVDVDAVLAEAGERLPGYMVPSAVVVLDAMPMNVNSKVDKKALAAMHVEIAVDALQTDTERALAAVWSQVLGVQVADIGRATSFFALGGDSISAIKAAAAMQRAGISITVPQLFKAQTVARVAVLADAADAHDGQHTATEWPAAVLSDETLAELASVGDFVDAYPATPLQAGMVAATMQDARAYVNQVPLRATRNVSLESLRGALHAVVQHHAILRTSSVSTVAGGIVQVVRASADAAECVAVTAPLAQHLEADKARGFSLADASWIRAALVCDPAGSAQHVVVTIHHALYDGWSLPMIMRDLAAALDGHALEPRPAFRTVVDFIAAKDAAATEAFWTQQLVGLEPAQPLSLGHSARTDDEDAPLAQACSTPMAELQRAAQRAGVTVAVVLKAAWAATLRKFTRSHDVVFGEVLANRDIAVAGADRIVGPLLNTVPCRVVLDDTARAADLVASLQAQHGAVLSHSHAALVDVQRWAGVQGDAKLFNTLFVFENMDLSVGQSILSAAASILAEFDFGVQQLVSALSDKATVESLWTLSPAQQAAIARFSHGERVPLPFSLVHHGFEARAKQHPDWRAVEHGDAHLSYGDLDACGCALAAALASHGVQRGSRVAVVMQRSIEFVVALVGVLKAGATIVPVDSSFPADRIQFMLDDASVCAIVTTASEAGRIAQLSVGDRAVVVADARALLASGVPFTPAVQHTATGDDDAFIVYTSGSTGKPKGVPVPQKGVVNVVTERSRRFDIQPGDRQGQFMAISFDACQSETWLALSNACTLVLREDDALRTASKIKTLFITPTGLAHLGSPKAFPNLKNVSVGGEICPKELKDLWAIKAQFDNAYGPTEISIISHAARLTQLDKVSIGRPIINASSYVLDSRGGFVPVGVVGEMHIGGIGVSRGYINLPDLTAQRFVPDPFSPEPGARMFRTGDLGRLLPDGNFEILGRMDDQVKLKGYRIELDEVAAAMMHHPRVSAAAAVVKDKTHLVGFVVPADVDHDELRDVVAAALPAYMVPAVFVGLAVMPTNTNGKTDKKALAAMHVEIAVDALQTDTERALAAVWSQVLGVHVADIGRATSFFALGGDSISAIRMVSALSMAGLQVGLVQLLNGATISRIAAQIDCASQQTSASDSSHQAAYADDLDLVDDPSISAGSPLPFDFTKLEPSASPTFFLTGATGFLGAFVLQSLLERHSHARVVCLVRAESDAAATARLISTSKKHLAWSDAWLRDGRVRAVAGDLSAERFGLSDAVWDALCHEVDVIIHNGALVHWFYPYSEMRGPNVIGTRTGLQLATTHRLKPLHFVSTGSTLAHGDTLEDTDLEMSRTSLVGGYAQSKWVAEKLVMRARSRGVPATIFRPNRITGDSRNGVCNTDDFVWRLVKGAAQLGKIPRDPRVVNMSAVDHVAACLVEIALSPRSIELGAFHMRDHQGYTFDELFGSLAANGFAVERVAHGDWRNTLEATVHSEADNALFPVLPFVLGDDPDAPEAAEEGMLDDANMQAIIADARIPVIAPDHSRITPLSLGYMVAQQSF